MPQSAAVRNPALAIGLRSCALATLGAMTRGDESPEAAFLAAHWSVASEFGGVAEFMDACIEDPAPRDLPLLSLASQLELNRVELLAVAIASVVETNVLCGRAIAHLQAPVGGSRPSLGLLAEAFAEFAGEQGAMGALTFGAAVECGLLQLLNEGAPLAERTVATPMALCMALHGGDAIWPGAEWISASVPLPPSTLKEAERQAGGVAEGSQRALVLRSGSGAEARSVAQAIASVLGRRAALIDGAASSAGLVPWLLLWGAIPVFTFDPAPGERKSIPSLPRYEGPVLAICGAEGAIQFRGETAASWTLAVPPKEERLHLWQAALGNSGLAAELAAQHRHGSGRIAHLGRMARHHCIVDGRTQPEMRDVSAASWVAEGPGLETLAQALPEPIPDDAFVMSPGLREELDRLLSRCRSREGLTDGLGASAMARYRPGVRALFTGPSGTGKTLAAGWLATRLGLPLYRVDLASVTSKYIGETEKNLAQLLARAEQSEVILLFDEADSLFGKRTEVKDSNDRFANAQTNYLLQRIESYDGITFLTSNSRARFDTAFARRLDAIVEFPVPGPEERRSLWQSHLGAGHRLTQRELNQLAAAADLCGGNIRNAVLTAAVMAQAANRQIEYVDLWQALVDEYRKLGRQMPAQLATHT